MRYRIGISEKARDQLRALPRETRRNIGQRLEAMREDLRGDVLKLKAKGNRYRLRVGTYRVLFVLAGDVIQVYAVRIAGKPMSEAAILEKIQTLHQTVARLQERVEDLEDLRDLEEAIAENAGKPLLPWEQVKAELERE